MAFLLAALEGPGSISGNVGAISGTSLGEMSLSGRATTALGPTAVWQAPPTDVGGEAFATAVGVPFATAVGVPFAMAGWGAEEEGVEYLVTIGLSALDTLSLEDMT